MNSIGSVPYYRLGIYYMPASRGYRPHRFVGLYRQKAIRGVIDVESVFEVTADGEDFQKKRASGAWTDQYDERIKQVIAEAKVECGHDIRSGHLFFCGDVATTRYRKESKGGIQGARYFSVPNEITSDSSLHDFASSLHGRSWI